MTGGLVEQRPVEPRDHLSYLGTRYDKTSFSDKQAQEPGLKHPAASRGENALTTSFAVGAAE
jgi:hypothetical protein